MAEKKPEARKLAVLDEVKTPPGLPPMPAQRTPWGLTDLPFKGGDRPYLDSPDDYKFPHDGPDQLYPSPVPIPQRKAKR